MDVHKRTEAPILENRSLEVSGNEHHKNTTKNTINPVFDTKLFNKKEILNDAKNLAKQSNNGLFISKSANDWMKEALAEPVPEKLFSELWLEGEVCILYASSNVGKSILAVQIADSITKDIPISGFKLEAKKQAVLYCDFELSKKQFQLRYTGEFDDPYFWDDSFKRIELNSDFENPGNIPYEDFLNDSIEKEIINQGYKVIIIDNLTYIKNNTEKAKDALPLMQKLKSLKNKYNLSILILAHTPKRDETRPITMNDLAGSSHLMNFIDTSFAIGRSSTDKNVRYIKQIKARSTEVIYDAENIITCMIEKQSNFLQFVFIGFGSEFQHLKQVTENEKDKRISEAINLKKQGFLNIEIARKFSVSEGAVRKWLKKSIENEAPY
jgi:hypothetical protein